MVSTTRSKTFYFFAFLAPAFIFYLLFFVIPLLQGVWYSFTDWNGIMPEIPLTMEKQQFEEQVLKQISIRQNADFLREYYRLSPSGDAYNLRLWIAEDGQEAREITKIERRRIKRLLRSVGISNIKFIGFANFREMFQKDTRFMPRFERRYLYNEFDDLPSKITAGDFRKKLLAHVENSDDRAFLLANFQCNGNSYLLSSNLDPNKEDRLRSLLTEHMHQKIFIPNVLGFTLFFAFFNVVLSNILALILALILDGSFRTKIILRSIFFMPNILSLVIVAFIWHFIFMLVLPRLTGIEIWLGSTTLAPWAVVIVSVWQSCGWLMVIYLAGLQTIPIEYLEAARVDGANLLQRLRYIKFPLLIPAFTICLFYSLSNSLKSFDIIFALTQGNPAYSTVPVVLDIYYNAFNLNRFGYATAKAVFLCVIIMLVTGLQLYLMKRKEVQL